jgi:hypothetical protein
MYKINGCIVKESYTLCCQQLLDATLTQDLTCEVLITPTLAKVVSFILCMRVTTDGITFTAITAPVSPFVATVVDGTYQFRVTDTQGCHKESEVTAKRVLHLSTTKSDVNCIR